MEQEDREMELKELEREVEALWTEEAERPVDEPAQRLMTEIPAEEVLRRARAGVS
ncbi:MAG: hypothetical protein AB1646_16135 [Thermodesulfobacteriota bacterium]